MPWGRGSPEWGLGHQDHYQLAEVLSQVALQITPAPRRQRGLGLIQIKGEMSCQIFTSGYCKGQSDKSFGKRNDKYGCCRIPQCHGEGCFTDIDCREKSHWDLVALRDEPVCLLVQDESRVGHNALQSSVFFLVVAGTCLNLS